jgi:lipid-binding SYLF domain-containing protein
MKMILKSSAFILIIPLFLACASTPQSTDEPIVQQLLVDQARIVVDTFTADPEMEGFRTYLRRARGALIVPEMYKAAWFLGGAGGRGVLLAQNQMTGQWKGPAFYTMGSVSLGIQFGGQKSESIILVMTQKGMKSLSSSSIKLGGDASIAIGPVGVGAQGATRPSLNVDFITFSRTKGAFIGLSLDGAVINEDYDWNKAYYGEPMRPVDILEGDIRLNPNSAKLRTAINRALLSAQ